MLVRAQLRRLHTFVEEHRLSRRPEWLSSHVPFFIAYMRDYHYQVALPERMVQSSTTLVAHPKLKSTKNRDFHFSWSAPRQTFLCQSYMLICVCGPGYTDPSVSRLVEPHCCQARVRRLQAVVDTVLHAPRQPTRVAVPRIDRAVERQVE